MTQREQFEAWYEKQSVFTDDIELCFMAWQAAQAPPPAQQPVPWTPKLKFDSIQLHRTPDGMLRVTFIYKGKPLAWYDTTLPQFDSSETLTLGSIIGETELTMEH